MTTTFDAARASIDADRTALLRAIADGGDAGRRAYEAAQAQVTAQRQAALSMAASAARGRGALAGFVDQLSSTVAAPYDRQSAALGQAEASRTADLGQRQASGEAYLGEVQGALPVLQAQAERQLAELRARRSLEDADRAIRREISANSLARSRESRARAGLGGSLSDSELRTRLLGAADEFARGQGALADRYRSAVPSSGPVGPGSVRLVDEANYAALRAATPREALARSLGGAAGLDTARVAGLVPDARERAAARTTQAQHRADVVARVRAHANPGTIKAFQSTVAAAGSLAAALALADGTPEAKLRAIRASRSALIGWLNDYYSL